MSRHDRTPSAGSDRTNLYDEITDKIIAELEAGRFPWAQPWGKATVGAPLGLPQNASTGRIYSGINILILWGAVIQHGFPGQGWCRVAVKYETRRVGRHFLPLIVRFCCQWGGPLSGAFHDPINGD